LLGPANLVLLAAVSVKESLITSLLM
jgi:hypothetical protein